MKKRGDYLKKAYYHLMKIEQKKNKILQVENYGEINAELNRKFAKGEYFDSSEVYVEDGYLCVGEGVFLLNKKDTGMSCAFRGHTGIFLYEHGIEKIVSLCTARTCEFL